MSDWLFVGEVPVTEPPLPEDFGVGSSVLVLNQDPRWRSTKPATVVKKGRVWVTVAPIGLATTSNQVWRFRLDTQTDGANYGYPMRFRTPEQQRYFEALSDAAKYFLTIGLRTEGYGYSPVKRANLIELARLIYNSGLIPEN